ncbi:hypothetical protein L211DRAFT_857963 [Terfezia boudieri ATCC MYA-4762]|uniref:Uncharacterized protein n=1 Tax=Terfezia boudieri ATCC MYA-4762 TaxID=1051890 RepID=A0A3N4LJ44_9PEZI|nr:hypothetical protein L211DRAFT_857963 [Terfezia boudieri ATCC MYA-4762]
MPVFFDFERGTESRTPPPPDPRYGRFRSFPADYGHHNPNPNQKLPKHPRNGGTVLGRFGDHRGPYGALAVTRGGGRIGTTTVPRVGLGGGVPDVWEDQFGEGFFEDEGVEGDVERWWWERWVLSPRRRDVRVIVGSWWRKVGVLIVLPAVVSIIWCAIPFPTYPLDAPNMPPPIISSSILHTPPTDFKNFTLLLSILRRNFITTFTSPPLPSVSGTIPTTAGPSPMPGHGHALVRLNFWFFLLVYYGTYNLISLLWITKLFNLYSLNWWPSRLGFPISYTSCWILSLIIAVPLYLNPELVDLTSYNLTWILLMFSTMTWPLLVAVGVMVIERRNGRVVRGWVPSEAQALFAPELAGVNPISIYDTPSRRGQSTRFSSGVGKLENHGVYTSAIIKPHQLHYLQAQQSLQNSFFDLLPSSYLRFIWFLLLLLLSLIAYLLGEAYSELYLRTLPHNNLSNILYVYTWIFTIYTLDFVTSYILSTHIISTTLEYAYKLFFALTYQTFVRALYARLRNPGQFLVLQGVSVGGGVVWYLVTMSRWWYRIVSYFGGAREGGVGAYRKYVGRGLFIRGIAENVSMCAWVGWVVVLHYGGNRVVYPYFAFESGTGGWWPGYGDGDGIGASGENGGEKMYTFELTFWMSLVTWVSEVLAGWVVRGLVKWVWEVDVERDAGRELVRFPELVGVGVIGGVHVLQNMLVGIVRVRFA